MRVCHVVGSGLSLGRLADARFHNVRRTNPRVLAARVPSALVVILRSRCPLAMSTDGVEIRRWRRIAGVRRDPIGPNVFVLLSCPLYKG